MRDTKRTPGPWHVERYVVDRSSGREVGAWERGSLIERRRVTAGDGMIVADLVAGGPADATLLAAAPLLAELAHRLVVSLQCSGVDAAEGSNDPLEALHHDAIEALRAAGVASPETAMAQAALAPAPSPAATDTEGADLRKEK